MKLVLDTNVYRRLVGFDPPILEHLRRADVVALPIPVLAELRVGFRNGGRALQNEAVLSKFLDEPRCEVLVCDEATTHIYADLRLQLKRQGTPIPMNDIWIAALVLQHRGTLLTFDSDFDHLPQLPRVS